MPVSDDELRRALGRDVEVVRRRRSPAASSLPLEEVEVRDADGATQRLVVKDAAAARTSPRPDVLVDPARELAVYRDVLAPAGVGAPELRGALEDGGRVVLVLEAVEGDMLADDDDPEAWDAAARWLARLHTRPLPAATGALLDHLALARTWRDRAIAIAGPRVVDADAAATALAVLDRRPRALVHGEFYAANVLVAVDGRIRPVDWETAGVGPGVLDLAALTSGDWTERERRRMAEAYRDGLGGGAERPDADELWRALAAARVVVALQWLGWDPAWTPPAEHATDWGAELRAAARELAR